MQRQKLGLIFIFLLVAAILTGCRGEITRASIQEVGEFQITFEHDRTPVELWTDLDIEYINETNIWYEIEIKQNGDQVAVVVCDPFDYEYKIMARRVNVRGVTKESYLALMECELGNLPEGKIVMNVALMAEGGRVRIFRADLVVKEKE